MILPTFHQRDSATTRFSTAMADAPSNTCEAVATVAALPSGAIGGGEIVLLAIKPSMWRPVFESGSWLVTTIVLAVVLAALGQPIPGLSLAATSRLILLVGLARHRSFREIVRENSNSMLMLMHIWLVTMRMDLIMHKGRK